MSAVHTPEMATVKCLKYDQRVSPSGTRYNVQTAISEGVSTSRTNTITVNIKTTVTVADRVPSLAPSLQPPCLDHDAQPVDESAAKLWVRKPGGAIRRKDRIGVSLAGSLRLVRVL